MRLPIKNRRRESEHSEALSSHGRKPNNSSQQERRNLLLRGVKRKTVQKRGISSWETLWSKQSESDNKLTSPSRGRLNGIKFAAHPGRLGNLYQDVETGCCRVARFGSRNPTFDILSSLASLIPNNKSYTWVVITPRTFLLIYGIYNHILSKNAPKTFDWRRTNA